MSITSLFGGSSSKTDRNKQLEGWGDLSKVANFGINQGKAQTKEGEGNLSMGEDYFKSLLSNDPGKIAQAIQPQVSAIAGQEQQTKSTNSQFGNRSGGTNASNQMVATNASSAVQNLVNTLIPQAASQVASIGATQEGLGLQSLGIGKDAASTLSSEAGQARQTDVAQQNKMGAGLGSLLSAGLDNLDTTGGSSGLEQVGNFALGAFL